MLCVLRETVRQEELTVWDLLTQQTAAQRRPPKLTSHLNTAVFRLQVFFYRSQCQRSLNSPEVYGRKPYSFVDLASQAMLSFALIFWGQSVIGRLREG